jgi:hypothetical protein
MNGKRAISSGGVRQIKSRLLHLMCRVLPFRCSILKRGIKRHRGAAGILTNWKSPPVDAAAAPRWDLLPR